WGTKEGFKRAIQRYFGDNRDTFRNKLSCNIDNLQRQIEKEYLHEDYAGKELQTYRRELIYYMDALKMLIGKRALHESKWQMKKREVHAIKEIEKRLNESKMQTQEGIFNEGITLDAGLDSEASTDDNSSTEQHDGSSSLGYAADVERVQVDNVISNKENATVGPSSDNNTLTEVHHSNNDTFKNVFALKIQNHEQLEVENCTKVNREAQQANAVLTKELERYKEKEKHFAKETTNESEYCKKIKLLNEEISNLKSQACQKEKSFHKENEKYAEYVQPLLNRKNELEKTNQEFLKQINDLNNKLLKAGQTAQTFHMLLPKEDNVNTGKQGLGFENQNDVDNPFIMNKAKELTPSLYNINEMGKDLLSDHKINSKEELKLAKLLEENEQLKAQIQEMVFAHATLQNELRKSKGNSVGTKFAKPSILGKPPLQTLKNQSVVRQPNALKSERPKFSKPRFASQVDVKNDLSKPITPYYWPKVREHASALPSGS
ncbi:hypothetical protein Tco_0744131, partial [Tanacetum coccineum]